MSIGTYRKKPVEIEAVRWMGPPGTDGVGEAEVSVDELQEWGARVQPTGEWGSDYTLEVWNEPEECWVRCPVGHWIIRGVQGEFYPCDPDIFEATYDLVED